MNELQQVLLIFAIVVVIGLYFLSRSRQTVLKKEADRQKNVQKRAESDASYQKASQALNELGEPHIPVSQNTETRIAKQDDGLVAPEVNESQGMLPFGEAFNQTENSVTELSEGGGKKTEKEAVQDDLRHENLTSEIHVSEPINDRTKSEDTENKNPLGGNHHMLEVEDLGMKGGKYQYVAPEHEKPSFGIPDEEPVPEVENRAEKKEPQVFVILVMSTGQAFSMQEMNHALLGVGLSFNESQIYVKCDNMDNTIIKVANLMEPGTFPADELQNYTTTGVAMILELPCTVKAPAAMHDLIMMARKISQRLQGRLYNMERQLLKESDLQVMRDKAVKYESDPL
ncbi:MAG: cell division-like protein [Thiomicrorhabdus sp.]|nr:cell division-like protein [Thiomicrorhabdus sp.]